MEFGRCPRCREYKINPRSCGCELFYGWYEDTKNIPGEMREIYAFDYDEAAEAMAKKWFEGEFDIGPITVFVKRPDDDEFKEFLVESDVAITFHAIAA